jgi:hypothetical protein
MREKIIFLSFFGTLKINTLGGIGLWKWDSWIKPLISMHIHICVRVI